MTEQSRWRLRSIRIRSFRGVADEQVYEFDGRSGLLHGNNGVGKSTAAQCFQWTLYGKFPQAVLQNTALKGFMSPVSASSDAWFGEVTLVSGERTMILTRDHSAKKFTLDVDGKSYEGDEAEEERDRRLRLDMAGFVRTVLLQQSRIRGLLLDLPKDRNAALDRLLGMDDFENIASRIKPKDFRAASEARRQAIVRAQQDHEAREELLISRRDEAQQSARTFKFLSKDFNNVGLKKAYGEIDEMLQALAVKYAVEIDPLPPCDDVNKVATSAAHVDTVLSKLRMESNQQTKLTKIDNAISEYTRLRGSFEAVVTECKGLQEQKDNWLKQNGEHKSVVDKNKSLDTQLLKARASVKAAGELRQLLADALGFVEVDKSDDCPVCEQSIPSDYLVARLTSRLDSMTSEEIGALEQNVQKLAADQESVNAMLLDYEQREGQIKSAQDQVDGVRSQAVEKLGGKGIPEARVIAQLDTEIRELTGQRESYAEGAKAMEKALSEVQERVRCVREGLAPVIEARADLAKLEDDWKREKASHAAAELAAGELESTADKLTEIKSALLEAKNGIATDILSGASPRANELYRQLVRHPVFESLEIKTSPKANKIDYSFEVSADSRKSSAREARLVLSDGQVTATAIGLFFAFSETETHNLDLLYVDDPTQNLDQPCKEAMAKVITELASRRQVVVSTQDEDFVSFLEAEGYFDVAVVHHLERWDGNPVVKTKVAGGSGS